MRKLLIITFFVAVMATPLAAQPMTTPAMTPAMRPAVMAPAMKAARPVAMRPAPRPAMRPATTVAVPVAMAPSMAPAAPVAAMGAPATTISVMAPVAMTSDQPVMSAAPAEGASTTGKKDSKGSVVGGWLLQLLLGILGIALPIVLTPLVIWLLKKMKVEDAKAHQLIDETVDKAIGVGIHYAEEQSHKLKDNPIDGAKKLAMAGEKAQAYLKDSGIIDKGANYIKDLIEAKLGETRSAGVNGSKTVEIPEEKPVEEKSEDK